MPRGKSLSTETKYGVRWSTTHPLSIELGCIRMGGQWENASGVKCGLGMAYHMKAAISLFAPSYWWNRWSDQMLELYCDHKELSLLGGGSTGKTTFMAVTGLAEYFALPLGTTVIMSSTSLAMLEKRIWGEVKMWFNGAKKIYPWLPGVIIGSSKAIFTTLDEEDGRDERNGIFCVACRVGGKEIGIANYVGVKNQVVRLKADEGSYMSRAFLDGANNLDTNRDFKMTVSGNPNSTRDALGIVSEPEGGWDSIKQTEKTQVWKTRRARGVAMQLVGTDSPALDIPDDQPLPAPLIGRKKINDTIQNYTRNSLEFSREVLGHIMFGDNQRIVVTKELCEANLANERPVWNGPVTRIAHADISYSGVGGDDTVLCFSSFGQGVNGRMLYSLDETMVFNKLQIVGEPVQQSAEFCMNECVKRGIPPERFAYDGSGRSSFTSAIMRIWSTSVVALEFGGKATDRTLGKIVCNQKFDRFVTELWFAIREMILSKQFRGMTGDMIEEGSAREYVEKTQGGFVVQSILPKDKIKEILGFSPDKFDALVCGGELARRLGFRIDFSGTAQPNATRFKWLDNLAKEAIKARQESSLVYA
jgi:hypothetical protein